MSAYNLFLKNPLGAVLSNHIDGYPTPINLSYLWGFGSLAGIALVVQIVSGVLLAMHYAPEVHLAFISVEHIMRDVKGGFALRYIHANGASMFFIIVYIHMFRGLYYGSYYQPRSLLWYSGILIFFLMMATGFMGYVLPWGQMSFWGATVITNLFSAIPGIGQSIVQLLWGGFSVDNPTLNRFFSLHYLLPFVIAALAVLHIVFLHEHGSSSPTGLPPKIDNVSFSPYFIVKDLFGFWIFFIFFFVFVFFYPNVLGHTDNYIPANPLVTPTHIVPEWYFLPLYGILRSILDKTYGIIIMFISLFCLFFLPFLEKSFIRSKMFKPFNRIFFWLFTFNFIFLGFLGSQTPDYPFIELGLICAHLHLLYFFFFIPMSVLFEKGFLLKAIY